VLVADVDMMHVVCWCVWVECEYRSGAAWVVRCVKQ